MTTERDLRNQMAYAAQVGHEEGLAIGKAEGREEGRAEGRAEGREEGLKDAAKGMKALGLSDEEISKATGLDVEVVRTL